MSFGFSVGDFLTVGSLVLNLYNACKCAPGEFQEISRDLSSMHTVLSSLAEHSKDSTSLLIRRGSNRRSEWLQIKANLEGTLDQLQDVVARYKRMGKNAWKRVQLANENLSDLRAKLSFHLNAMNIFVSSLTLSALGRMEPVLGRIEELLRDSLHEEKAGFKARTVLSVHETDDPVSWKQIEMDLLLEGIAKEDFERHRDKIKELLDWVVENENDLADLEEVGVDDSVSQVERNEGRVGLFSSQQGISSESASRKTAGSENKGDSSSHSDVVYSVLPLLKFTYPVEAPNLVMQPRTRRREDSHRRDSGRKRRESENSVKAFFNNNSPKKPISLERAVPISHDSVVSAGSSSSHGKHRKDRTPEEQAAHDARKEAKRALLENEKQAKYYQ